MQLKSRSIVRQNIRHPYRLIGTKNNQIGTSPAHHYGPKSGKKLHGYFFNLNYNPQTKFGAR